VAPALFAVGMLGLFFVGARLDPILAAGETLLKSAFTIGAALAIVLGLTGLTTAWWSPIARIMTPQRDPLGFDGSPIWLFTLGIVAAAPAVTYLGIATWAEAEFGGRAWDRELARIRPLIPVAAIGIFLVLAVAWRVCFLPFRRTWSRWIPLPIIVLGSFVAMTVIPQ